MKTMTIADKIEIVMYLPVNLKLFDANFNATTDSALSDEMKTYYSDYLIDTALPNLVHEQFGQKHPIPKRGGKTIEFRKFAPLAKALTPITEGVTPAGNKLSVSTVEATIDQYGDYIEITDVLDLTAIDDNLVQATTLLGNQAGLTLDTITREVLNGGTNVQYADGQVDDRDDLYWTSEEDNCNLTVDAVRKAVRFLKTMNAPRINGYYAGIIHPDCAYDLMSDPKWVNVKTYSDPEGIYEGEIGRIEGVRFVESSEAKIWELAGSTWDADDEEYVPSTRDVYSTLIIGSDAYGITEVEGGGLQHIAKQLGSSGTSDPLNQRATAGWKAITVTERLVEEYMVRIESTSTFSTDAT